VNTTAAAEPGPTEPAAHAHPGRRRWGTRALVALAAILLVIGALGVWVNRVVLDTPTFTDTSSKALQDPVVQQAVSTYLVDQVYANVDVAAQLQAVLPDAAKPLAAPAAAGLRDFADRAALRALSSPKVQDLWEVATRQASRAVIATVEGHEGAVGTTNGQVTLNLQPLADQVANRTGIGGRLASAIPPGTGNIVLLKSDQLKTAQSVANVLRVIGDVTIIVVVILLAIAVWIAPDRRWAVRTSAFGLLAAALALIFVRRVLGDQIISSLVASDSIRPAAHRIWWIATEQLRLIITTVLFVGLVGLLGAILAGAGRRATAIRGAMAPYLKEPAIAYGTLTLVVLLLLAWSPTPAARNPLTIVVLLAMAVLGLEALRRQTAREFPEAERGGLSWSSLWGREEDVDGERLASLSRLGALHADGVLDDEEFEREKRRILSGPGGPTARPAT
jgi:putative oligomerization/nucleic acid binding protein